MNSRAEQRRALLKRVDRHDGHWHWTGTTDHRLRPVLWDPQTKRNLSARQLSWELAYGRPPGRLLAACGEPDCIRPDHLMSRERCIRGHLSPRTPAGGCKACQAQAQAVPWTCEHGHTVRYNNRLRHLRTCRGAEPPPDPVAELSATQDAVEDYQRGMTPERICEAYGIAPGTLEQRLRRQACRTEIETQFMRALGAFAQRVERS